MNGGKIGTVLKGVSAYGGHAFVDYHLTYFVLKRSPHLLIVDIIVGSSVGAFHHIPHYAVAAILAVDNDGITVLIVYPCGGFAAFSALLLTKNAFAGLVKAVLVVFPDNQPVVDYVVFVFDPVLPVVIISEYGGGDLRHIVYFAVNNYGGSVICRYIVSVYHRVGNIGSAWVYFGYFKNCETCAALKNGRAYNVFQCQRQYRLG